MTLLDTPAPGPGREPADAPSDVATPTVRAQWRRVRFWVGVAIAVVLAGLIGVAIAGTGGSAGTPFDPASAGPQGVKAMLEVLRDQGVEVRIADGPGDVLEAQPGESLALVDNGLLDGATVEAALDTGARVVIVEVAGQFTAGALPSVDDGLAVAGMSDDEVVEAACEVPAAANAERIVGSGSVIAGAVADGAEGAEGADATLPDGWAGCFPQRDTGGRLAGWSLVATDDGRIVVLGASDAITNDGIASEGNAALGLWLFGHDDTLTWYLPDLADLSAATGEPSLSDLTPEWVTPVLVLIALAVLAAAVWRGRRMGALVVENLPVQPRASETMEGRARLYRASGARERALDAIRIRTILQLGRRLGLGPDASVDAVIDRTASITSRAPGEIRGMLVDAQPADDRDLVRISDDLLELEREVARRVGSASASTHRATTGEDPR